MTAARCAAINAKDDSAAHSAEMAFHATWAAQIKALKDELGPGAWGILMSHKAELGGTVTQITKQGGKYMRNC